jgi:hypothetical protein
MRAVPGKSEEESAFIQLVMDGDDPNERVQVSLMTGCGW